MTAAAMAIVLIILPVFALASWLFTLIYMVFMGQDDATAGVLVAGVATSAVITLGLLL